MTNLRGLNGTTVSPELNLTKITTTHTNEAEYFNVTDSITNASLIGTELLINFSSTVEHNFTTDSGLNYTMITTDDAVNWTAGTNTTKFPEIIVFVNENNPSEPPTLNATSTVKDLDDKLNKAKKIGAIVGGVMGVVVSGIIVAIYFLYRKYHRESADF